MTIKNTWTDTIEAQRAALEIRARIINEVVEENTHLRLVFDCMNTTNAYQVREINRLRGVIEIIHKETLAKLGVK